MKNKTFAEVFKSRPELYPRHIEEKHSRILEALASLWGDMEIHDYFDKVLFDSRGNRQGFPVEVMQELMMLQKIHDHRFPRAAATLSPTGWTWADGTPIDPLDRSDKDRG
jgi:hypothetical protein